MNLNFRRIAIALFLAALAAPSFAASVTKDDIKKILDENPDLILDVLKQNQKELFDIVSKAAQQAQMEQEKDRAAQEQKERDEAFKHPYAPTIDASSHIRGNKKAKLTLVEYSDFQCPYCGMGFHTVEALRAKYGAQLRFIFKDMPLPMHPQAMPAARYFEAAALQSPEKAWLLHDKFFNNQQSLGPDFFKKAARDLGLDVAKLEKDANSQKVQDIIDADAKEAQSFDFHGTPGFLVNGVPVRGNYPIEEFDSIIQKLQSSSKSKS